MTTADITYLLDRSHARLGLPAGDVERLTALLLAGNADAIRLTHEAMSAASGLHYRQAMALLREAVAVADEAYAELYALAVA